jgi:hypothetical protein
VRVDAPGLVLAAQRLLAAVEALRGAGIGHPPLAADPASVAAAARLSTAGAELSTALAATVSALVASVEQLTGVAISYLATDEANAAAIGALDAGAAGAAPVPGSAPPAPPVPPDVRAPMPPPAPMLPEAVSAAVHSGAPAAGEPFIAAWTQAGDATAAAAATLRSAVAALPETLDGPASTPAVSRHLLGFAEPLDTYSVRGHRLAAQAAGHAGDRVQAGADVPGPPLFVAAQNRIQTIAHANALSGGKHAVALANAIGDKNRLNEKAIVGYGAYVRRTDATTAGEDPGSAGGSGATAGATGPGEQHGGPLSPENAGEMASLLPQLLPAMLGAAGGIVGGVMGAAAKVPEALMQAGSQALGAATQGLSGLAHPKPDLGGAGGGPPGLGAADPAGGGVGGGGDAPTLPASGAGSMPLGVAPSTGAPPTPAVLPVGAVDAGLAAESAGGAGMPMFGGMPMMGGMPMAGEAGGGGAGGGKGEADRQRRVVVRDVPHTEDVTGRVDTTRLAAAAAANRDRDRDPEPPADGSADSAVVRRLVTHPPKEPT